MTGETTGTSVNWEQVERLKAKSASQDKMFSKPGETEQRVSNKEMQQ